MRSLSKASLIAAAVVAGFSSNAAEPAYGRVTYGAGKAFKTGVYQPRLLAELPNAGGEPFLVIAGLGCSECDINLSIYIHSPSQGPMQEGERAPRFSYPGQYRDYMSNALVESVRMFAGRCTPDGSAGVVWFQTSKVAAGKWRNSTYVAKVEGAGLVETGTPPHTVSLSVAQAAIARGVCSEIPGKRFNTEP